MFFLIVMKSFFTTFLNQMEPGKGVEYTLWIYAFL